MDPCGHAAASSACLQASGHAVKEAQFDSDGSSHGSGSGCRFELALQNGKTLRLEASHQQVHASLPNGLDRL